MNDNGSRCDDCNALRRDAINKIAMRLMHENPAWPPARVMDRAKIEHLKGSLE